METMAVRTRFAPSPTGTLHIGGARTALFSWLYARRHGGQFILRMEDTDLARSTRESVDQVLRALRWLGLDWDEGPAMDGQGNVGPVGPYFQTQRLELYAGYLQQLKDKGLAYPCFDSKAEVEAEREAAIAEGRAPTGSFEEATPAQIEAMRSRGVEPAWRFRIPEGGLTEFEDLVHGHMRFENRLMADFVIVRSDGMPTYNFAATIDDSLMEITHVIRGDDHLSNTPRQVCLYRALGLREPAFAHIPMILGPDKQRLSKRHGATAVGEYETGGFLPEALINYLALLGWSLDDKTTLISTQ
jgi:glutamyl-tRNA synthetase